MSVRRRAGMMIIEKVEHRGYAAPIYLNKGESTFSCDILPGKHHEGKNLEGLRREIIRDIDAHLSMAIEWLPCIQVKETHPWNADNDLFIGMEHERFHIGKRPDGYWVEVDWTEEKEKRLRESKMFRRSSREEDFSLPFIDDGDWRGERTYYLPFSEELWAGLQELQLAIQKAKEKLRQALSTAEGRKRLENVGRQILRAIPEKIPKKGGEDEG